MATLIIKPLETTVSHVPAAATQATVNSESPNLQNDTIVVDMVHVSIACAGTAQTPLQWALRDGAGGTIRLTGKVAAPIGGMADVVMTDLNIPMTPGNLAQLQFEAAGVAASEQTVSMSYHRSMAVG
jgi:hypothetical protein